MVQSGDDRQLHRGARSLLEEIRHRAGSGYLSDLRLYLPSVQAIRAAVYSISATEHPQEEWQTLLSYLTDSAPEGDADALRQQLLNALKEMISPS